MGHTLSDSVTLFDSFALWELGVLGYPLLSCYGFKVLNGSPVGPFVHKVDLKQTIVHTGTQMFVDIIGS